METLKAYAGLIKGVLVLLIMLGTVAAWHWHGNQRYEEGRAEVRALWDKDKDVRQAMLDSEKQRNQETIDDLNTQHRKDLAAAESKAGRAAVDRWLREHGLLPSGLPLHPGSEPVPAQGSQVPDGAAGQQGAGDGLAGFATGCAQDALKLMDWQDLCVRQRCEVE